LPSDGEDNADDGTPEEESGEENGGPMKKRRKCKPTSPVRIKIEKGKGSSGSRAGKARKASVDDENVKKKRGSTSAPRPQRENLTEEQKRDNHIKSEQKRRNLIKKGFSDLHELVPELRNGSLSKSSVLMEAANYLEKLLADNEKYAQIIASSGG
jgi:hypothetical protein